GAGPGGDGARAPDPRPDGESRLPLSPLRRYPQCEPLLLPLAQPAPLLHRVDLAGLRSEEPAGCSGHAPFPAAYDAPGGARARDCLDGDGAAPPPPDIRRAVTLLRHQLPRLPGFLRERLGPLHAL